MMPQPGHRVGVMRPKVAYLAITCYGAVRAGGVVVPMNALLEA
jgi:acyl-CoA synthetase (AMP-forming)/AMP-acid ligase II